MEQLQAKADGQEAGREACKRRKGACIESTRSKQSAAINLFHLDETIKLYTLQSYRSSPYVTTILIRSCTSKRASILSIIDRKGAIGA